MTTTPAPRISPPVSENLSWRDKAACFGYPPDWWFPGPGATTPEAESAFKICRVCPVVLQCRDYARRHKLDGIWGAERR